MVDLQLIQEAHSRIAEYIERTLVVRCDSVDQALNGQAFFKCENLQAAGAFKSRGACNAVFSLTDDEARRGVVTHSSGNHAAALSRAAALRGIPAFVVMPKNSRPQKVEAVKKFGGRITMCEPGLENRERTADEVIAETGATMIHPYDDERIIAGQGTAALELFDQVPGLDVVMTPVGGGGLLSGTAIAAKSLRPEIEVWAGEPRGADDAYRSWKSGQFVPSTNPQTIADGLLTSLGKLTFPIIMQYVSQILLAGEPSIVDAVRWLHRDADLTVEPSAAVTLAALAENNVDLGGRKIGIILSGGNFDFEQLPVCG
jgi:threonine dehydratase